MRPDVRRFSDAKSHLEILCQAFPADAGLQLQLGRCEEALGNSAAAEFNYTAAIRCDLVTLVDPTVPWPPCPERRRRRPAPWTTGGFQSAASQGLVRSRPVLRARATTRSRTTTVRPCSARALPAEVWEKGAPSLVNPMRTCSANWPSWPCREVGRRKPAPPSSAASATSPGPALSLCGRQARNRGPESQGGHPAIPPRPGAVAAAKRHHAAPGGFAHPEKHDWKEAEAIEKEIPGRRVRRCSNVSRPAPCYEKSQWLEASRLLEKARAHVVSWPELAVRADVWLATCYGHLGDPARQQEVVLRRALRRSPGVRIGLHGHGRSALAKGLYSKALDTYRPAAASSPYARLRRLRSG